MANNSNDDMGGCGCLFVVLTIIGATMRDSGWNFWPTIGILALIGISVCIIYVMFFLFKDSDKNTKEDKTKENEKKASSRTCSQTNKESSSSSGIIISNVPKGSNCSNITNHHPKQTNTPTKNESTSNSSIKTTKAPKISDDNSSSVQKPEQEDNLIINKTILKTCTPDNSKDNEDSLMFDKKECVDYPSYFDGYNVIGTTQIGFGYYLEPLQSKNYEKEVSAFMGFSKDKAIGRYMEGFYGPNAEAMIRTYLVRGRLQYHQNPNSLIHNIREVEQPISLLCHMGKSKTKYCPI